MQNLQVLPAAAAAVQVYLRIRPLIPEEDGHDAIAYEVDDDAARGATFRLKLPDRGSRPPPNGAFARAPPLLHRRAKFRAFGGLAGILREDRDNEAAYRTAARPLVAPVASDGESACVFTYGHTGSGKSHTLLGYGEERGMYRFAAVDLLEAVRARDPAGCLLVRVTELYGDQVVDLLTREPCSILQDGKGQVRMRGPMVEDDQGRIEQKPLGTLCRTPSEVAECVAAACTGRRVGSSTHHDQSSRSHLVLELEVVTPELVDKRNELSKQNAHLTRLKWLQTERAFNKHSARQLPKWTEEYSSATVRREIKQFEGLTERSREELRRISQGLGGTLVFCDLAGNEYASDSAASTEAERDEAAEINRSLLAVKAMIRSLGQRQRQRQNGTKNAKSKNHHVPYRDSKLTMCLKRHLETRAVMLAHVSPSAESLKKTTNTLNYCSMANTSGIAASKGGKENNQ